jgi:hypothetical protein
VWNAATQGLAAADDLMLRVDRAQQAFLLEYGTSRHNYRMSSLGVNVTH